MKDYNLESSDIRIVAEKILLRNLIKPVLSGDKGCCDMCGHKDTMLYDYIDGYNHSRWICSICALINIPFAKNSFRINSLTKGFLIINPEKLSVTIITNSINIKKVDQDDLYGIELVDSKQDMYGCLIKVVNSSKTLQEKRYIIELGKRMHQYIHLTKASFGKHLYIATESSGLHVNIDLIEHIVSQQSVATVESVTKALKSQLGHLDKSALRAYVSATKEVLEE